jgi:tRNA-2-methylthio-N6-dimethylallyladenosine synthase
MPLQSGSDKVLRAMRRSYRTSRYMGIVAKVRAAMPDAQITTDVIVGFPGETEDDFQQTMEVLRQARFSSAYIFEYSPRPGTPAASMEQIPHEIVQDRFERLQAMQEQITEEVMHEYEGKTVEVLITAEGRKDQQTHRFTGRDRAGNLVHVGVPEGHGSLKLGDLVECTVTHAARHHLIADPDPVKGEVYRVKES